MTIAHTTDEMPAAATPAPGKQVIAGTALAALAGSTLIGGMLAIWALLRDRVVSDGERFPVDYIITEVASNVMLITVWALCFFMVWAVVSGRSGDRAHTGVALMLVALMAIAFINGQAFVWGDMGVAIDESYYGALFYAMTGTMVALVVAGLIYTAVATFRALSGRLQETHILTALAVYWFFVAAAYSAVWFLVYVTK